jgi:hypothetical protein
MRISKSLAVKVGAVVATAAVAVSGAMAAADASTAASHPQKIATALSIGNTTPKAHPHQTTAWIYGQLTAPNDHNAPIRFHWVVLQRLGRRGHWYGVQAERTGRNGRVRFFVHVRKTAVTFRLIFRGNANLAKSVSAMDTIHPVSS